MKGEIRGGWESLQPPPNLPLMKGEELGPSTFFGADAEKIKIKLCDSIAEFAGHCRRFDRCRNTVTKVRHQKHPLVDASPGKRLAMGCFIMLKITTQTQNDTVRILVEGKLTNGFIDELERCWMECASQFKNVLVEFVNIPFVETDAKGLLSKMVAQGAMLSAREIHMKAILKEIELENSRKTL
jgi:hypothetical protein